MSEVGQDTGQDVSNLATRLGRDVLRWLAAVEDSSQFTADNLRAALGMELPRLSDGPERYWSGDVLTRDWRYGVLLDRSQPSPRFELSFRSQSHDDPSMRAIAGVDLETASNELADAGFDRAIVRAEHGRIDHFRFSRDALTVEIYARGESVANPERQCIRMLVAR
ncbi:MAG: hypothetical protein ACREP7_01925 [Lysobacter sp.]